MRSGVVISTFASLFFVVWVVEAIVFRTVLITPLPQELLWTVWLLFGAMGAWLGSLMARGDFYVSAGLVGRMRAALATTIVVLALGSFSAFLADTLTRRVANVALFWNSHAPITVTAFPITSEYRGRNGRTLSVGLHRSVSVSHADIALLDSAGKEGAHAFCIPLRHQKQGDAERVWFPKHVRPNSPATMIMPCRDAAKNGVRPNPQPSGTRFPG
ncbi:hypothetical protein [Terrihabitans rhizophilus]|uniref:Uncharacterized protein n=1 Tax=Terrihabitans rhizophilus TaxID=3092662 RepID=A0ABU4RS28_9HYPH|nr:hypothetical protein [Terrihabitans sp. PJ23]MDX6807667.1 hypothetical protein [Terrihabitans sp. PJ23]